MSDPTRLTWCLPGGPHVIEDAQPATGCKVVHDPEEKKPPRVVTFAHGMSARARPATSEEVQRWREQR